MGLEGRIGTKEGRDEHVVPGDYWGEQEGWDDVRVSRKSPGMASWIACSWIANSIKLEHDWIEFVNSRSENEITY